MKSMAWVVSGRTSTHYHEFITAISQCGITHSRDAYMSSSKQHGL